VLPHHGLPGAGVGVALGAVEEAGPAVSLSLATCAQGKMGLTTGHWVVLVDDVGSCV
jgi:hypothetical protein